ncbi:Transporter of the ATP-binding cassette (ABC), partial [Linderina macrospora]
MWGDGLSRTGAALHARTLVNSVIVVLLLVVHPLPQVDYMTEAIPAHLRGSEGESKRRLTGKINVRQESPELRSSIASNGMFRWMNRFIDMCLERQAMPSDLYVQPDRYHVEWSQRRFAERGQRVRRWGLGWQLVATFRGEIFVQVVLNLYNTVTDYIQPYLMQRLLRFVDEYSRDRSIGLRFGYFLAAMMLATSVLGTVVEQQQQWHSRSLVMYMRNVVVVKLSSKTLRRRTSESAKQADGENQFGGKESTDGRVYNILTADISRLSKTPSIWNVVLVSPVQLVLGCLYMYSLLGVAGLVGMSLIF